MPRQTPVPDPTPPPAAALRHRLLDWIRGDDAAFSSFDEAAAAVFRHQYQHNTAYRRYWDARGVAAPGGDGFDWRSAPALPTDCFKEADIPPRAFPSGETRRVFLTSGTTREVRGRHEFDSLEPYETSIREGWKQLGLPAIDNPWFLAPPASSTPESSLGHMFATLGAGFGDRWLMDENGSPDTCRLAALTEPAGLFSTSVALFRLMENHPPLPLPAGSWIFETGGPKGLSVTLEPSEFHQQTAAFFSILPDRVLNEYSMTELSSQFYRWHGETSHRGPRWTRIRVIDPETEHPAPEGRPGYLEIIDLANLGSVAAIRTQDLAIATAANSFELLGRDPAAVPRGCSRAADDLWRRRTGA